jgi:hypothetical protein
VPILLCTTHFSRKTQNIFLSTGVFPENFELNNSGKKTEPSLRKELTSFLQIKSLHKPSIYIRIAQHMRTAHSEFVKKGNSVQSAEIPFAINPFEKLPTGRVKKPEETEFEDTDSDEPTISQTGQPEKEPCLADHISADVANQSPTREVVNEHEPACVPSAVVSEIANPSTCSVDTTSDRICQCSEKNVCISCRRKRQFVSYEQCSKFQNSQQIFDVHFVEPYQPNSSHQEIISLSQKYNNLAHHFNTLMNKVAIQDLVKNGVSVRCKCSTEEMKLKNVDEVIAYKKEALCVDGKYQTYMCRSVSVYLRKGNIMAQIDVLAYAGDLDMKLVNKYAQIIADRMNQRSSACVTGADSTTPVTIRRLCMLHAGTDVCTHHNTLH